MTNQPPKSSIHQVLLGGYKPSIECVTQADCSGIQFDSTSGVKNNFDVTIEIVNGIECRPGALDNQRTQSANRATNYRALLSTFGATQSADEQALPIGCRFIADNFPAKSTSAFDLENLRPGWTTWIDLSGTTCTAQSNGGAAMVSITASGIVDACLAVVKPATP